MGEKYYPLEMTQAVGTGAQESQGIDSEFHSDFLVTKKCIGALLSPFSPFQTRMANEESLCRLMCSHSIVYFCISCAHVYIYIHCFFLFIFAVFLLKKNHNFSPISCNSYRFQSSLGPYTDCKWRLLNCFLVISA